MLAVMKIAMVVVAACVACGSSKAAKCEDVRDKALPEMERRVTQAVSAEPPAQAKAIRDQGAKEIAQFKASFVDVCKQTENLDFSCFEGAWLDNKYEAKCKATLDSMWKQIYR
jgi:hypothetical protein